MDTGITFRRQLEEVLGALTDLDGSNRPDPRLPIDPSNFFRRSIPTQAEPEAATWGDTLLRSSADAPRSLLLQRCRLHSEKFAEAPPSAYKSNGDRLEASELKKRKSDAHRCNNWEEVP